MNSYPYCLELSDYDFFKKNYHICDIYDNSLCKITIIEKILYCLNITISNNYLQEIYTNFSCYRYQYMKLGKKSIFYINIFRYISLRDNLHLFLNEEIFRLFLEVCIKQLKYHGSSHNTQSYYLWCNNETLKEYLNEICFYVHFHKLLYAYKIDIFYYYYTTYIKEKKDLDVFFLTKENSKIVNIHVLKYIEKQFVLENKLEEYIKLKDYIQYINQLHRIRIINKNRKI